MATKRREKNKEMGWMGLATAKACFSEKMEEFSPKNTPCAIAYGTVAVLPTNNPITSSSVGYLVCDTIKEMVASSFQGFRQSVAKIAFSALYPTGSGGMRPFYLKLWISSTKSVDAIMRGCDYARMRGNR